MTPALTPSTALSIRGCISSFDWERAKDDIQPLIDSAVDGVNAGVNACADGVYGCIDGAVDVISGRLDDYKSARRAEKRA